MLERELLGKLIRGEGYKLMSILKNLAVSMPKVDNTRTKKGGSVERSIAVGCASVKNLTAEKKIIYL